MEIKGDLHLRPHPLHEVSALDKGINNRGRLMATPLPTGPLLKAV
ncbi:MAG: hypothetical protein R2867_04840 [Caldilineaceae bacterium]